MRKAILRRKLDAQTVHTGQKTRETLNLIEEATVVLNVIFVRHVERDLSITRKRNVIC